MKWITFFIVTLIGLAAKAQIKLPSKVFYAHEYICHVFGGTAKDYVLLLYPDSSVTFSVYMQKTGDFLQQKQKIEFRQTGTYLLNGDTLNISCKPVPNTNTATGLMHKDSSSCAGFGSTTKRFLVDRNRQTLLSLDLSMPKLRLTSLVALNQQLTISNRWQLNLKSPVMSELLK